MRKILTGLLALIAIFLVQCQKGTQTTEESVEEAVESVEVVRAVILQQVSEMDRALEVCKKKLEACSSGTAEAADTLGDTGYQPKDWDIDDLTIEELEVFQEMTMAELKGSYEFCVGKLEDCMGGNAMEYSVPKGLPLD